MRNLKPCKDCGKPFSPKDFHTNGSYKGRPIYKNNCRDCCNKFRYEWCANNRDIRNRHQTNYRRKHLGKFRLKSRAYTLFGTSTKGLTFDQLRILLYEGLVKRCEIGVISLTKAQYFIKKFPSTPIETLIKLFNIRMQNPPKPFIPRRRVA